MHVGTDHLRVDGQAHLGDPSILAQFADRHPLHFRGLLVEDVVPHDAQLARLTLAVLDLTDAVRELTATLNRPPWYLRLWARLRGRILIWR